MGSSVTLPLTADVESPTTPGKLSVLSDEIPCDFEAFIDELVSLLKYPVLPVQEMVLKEVKIEEDGPDTFTCTVILDGVKMASYGYGHPDGSKGDRIQRRETIMINRAERTMVSRCYNERWLDEEEKVVLWGYGKFLENPFRIEYWWEMGGEGGERKADEFVKGALQPWMDATVKNLTAVKVKMLPDAPSVGEPDKLSVVSPPLEEYTDYETMFENVKEIIKATRAQGGELIEKSADMFVIQHTSPGMQEDAEPVQSSVEYMCDVKAGTIISVTMLDDSVASREYVTIHQSPLVYEAYVETQGERKSGKALAATHQMIVNEAVTKKSSGWFGGLLG